MDEATIERIAEAVLQRLEPSAALPRACCIGTPPKNAAFLPVTEPPWDMVVLCSLSPAQLLSMPTDPVCYALLEGKPVYLMEEGLEHRHYPLAHAKALRSLLMAKQRQLRQLGVCPWSEGQTKKLLTAQDVRHMDPGNIPSDARLTPLARDILEGKA